MAGHVGPRPEAGQVRHLRQALGEHVEIAPGQPPVGGKRLGGDEEQLAAPGQLLVAQGQEPAHVDQPVLLHAGHAAVRKTEGRLGDLPRAPVPDLERPLRPQPGVLGEAGCVQEQGHPALLAYPAHRSEVAHGRRLPATAVVGDGHECHLALFPRHEGDRLDHIDPARLHDGDPSDTRTLAVPNDRLLAY